MSAPARALRYWHTLRHLKVRQMVARVRFRLRRPAPDLRPAPAVRRAAGAWRSPGWRDPSLIDAGTAVFLNVRASIAAPSIWQDRRYEHLWLYNLHYFDDLTARGATTRRAWHEALIGRWITENPPAAGVGWAPYPTALRIANWVKWLLDGSAGSIAPTVHDSLATQARWLSKRLEFHLLGNHLWANAKGLLMAGVYFDGPEAAAWRAEALRILSEELDEEVLADGGHFERSPMYHAIVLEDVLDLVQVDRLYPGQIPAEFVGRLRAAAGRMVRWLRIMTHPDGEIAFFNDAAIGIAANCGVLEDYARLEDVAIDARPLAPVEWLRDSGYVRLTSARASVFCDVAPVGPDYQPAHAHADTLSFELSVDGRRVIVNAGTSTYEPGPERDRQRSTRAHSTVEIDERNSSDVWSGFRVARRATPFDVHAGESGVASQATGAHDGYVHGPGVVHRRTWRLRDQSVEIDDELTGGWTSAVARFILHPDEAANPSVVFETPGGSAPRRAPARWHPRFGESRDTVAIEVDLRGAGATTRVRWV